MTVFKSYALKCAPIYNVVMLIHVVVCLLAISGNPAVYAILSLAYGHVFALIDNIGSIRHDPIYWMLFFIIGAVQYTAMYFAVVACMVVMHLSISGLKRSYRVLVP